MYLFILYAPVNTNGNSRNIALCREYCHSMEQSKCSTAMAVDFVMYLFLINIVHLKEYFMDMGICL